MSNIQANLKRKILEQEQKEENSDKNDNSNINSLSSNTDSSVNIDVNEIQHQPYHQQQKDWKELKEEWLEKIKDQRNKAKSFCEKGDFKEQSLTVLSFPIEAHEEWKDNKQKHTKKYLIKHIILINEHVFEQVYFAKKSMFTNKLEWLEKSTKEAAIETLKLRLYNEVINFFSTEEEREQRRKEELEKENNKYN